MAIAPAHLTIGGSDTDAIDYTTASVSPTAGTLVLASIATLDLGASLATPTCSGCGITWTLVAEVGGTTTQPRLAVFRAYADPGTVTAGAITFAGVVTVGQTADGAVWNVVEISGVDTTTNNGVVQTQVASSSTDSVSATLAAFSDAANGTVGVPVAYDAAGGVLDITEGSGFTMLSASEGSQAMGGDTTRIAWESRTDNDTTVDATATAANDRLLIVAMEIAASAATVTGTAAGAATASGTATGTRTVLGTSAGAATASGTATGIRTVLGTAAGAATSQGTAAGTPTVSGVGSGAATSSGTASGTRTVFGTANGAATSSGAATGTGGTAPEPEVELPERHGGAGKTRAQYEAEWAIGRRRRQLAEDDELVAVLTGV